jgi:hypothetical protein
MSSRILALINAGMSPAEVEAAVAPEREHLEGLDRKKRTYFRKAFGEMGYTPGALDVLFPKLRPGRPAGLLPPKDPAKWEGISGPVRAKICAALSEIELPTSAEWWTVERASMAADAISDHYAPNPGSQVSGLTRFRVGLKAVGAAKEIIGATKRPDITAVRNAAAAVVLEEAITKGIDFPEPYERLADLVARVDEWIAHDPKTWAPTSQVVADWFVVFVARPGEMETFELGPNGGIQGVLKKRGAELKEWPIESAVGEEKAREFFRWWEAIPITRRTPARKSLAVLLRKWTDDRRAARVEKGLAADEVNYTESTLRKIGADLASQARRPKNLGQSLAVMTAALRHETPKARAVDHYARMNTPELNCQAAKEDAKEDAKEPEQFDPTSVGGMRIGGDLLDLLRVASQLDPKKLAGLLQMARVVATM